MQVICGKLCGFCAGVNYAIEKAEETLDNAKDTIYCLGEIVHNEIVIKKLEDKGMITVSSIEEVPDSSKVIFRAHGEAKDIYAKARSKNIEIIDLICSKLKVIRKKLESEKDKAFIIIIGKKSHPEIIGNISFCGKYSDVIESSDDIANVYNEFKESNLNRLYIIAQTTFSSSKFDELVDIIKTTFNAEIIVDKTICDATENRQKETAQLAKSVDKMLIIGGKHSSNTKELAKIAEEKCKESFLIQSVEDLKDISFSDSDKVGVISGASTAIETVSQVVEHLKNI